MPRRAFAVGLVLTGTLLFGRVLAACTPTPELWGRVQYWAKGFGLDPLLLYALVWEESRFCPQAVGSKGEIGLGQVRSSTALSLGVRHPSYLYDPDWNLYATARYLRSMYERFGDWRRALQAYNAGPSRVASGTVPASSRRYAERILASYAWLRQRLEGRGRGGG